MELSELLRYVVNVLEKLGLRYQVTGSTATVVYGEPRFTNDIDIVVDLGQELVKAFCDAFPMPDFYVSEEAARQAIERRSQFNIIHPSSGLKVDVIIPRDTAFDKSRLSRAVRLKAGPDFEAFFTSPEDVILKKLEFYQLGGSEKHLRDITGVLKILGPRVDQAYIARWAAALHVEEAWRAVLQRAQGRPPCNSHEKH